MSDRLDHTDFLGRSRQQADRLRRLAARERVDDLDWHHLIEALGRSEPKSVRCCCATPSSTP
ncbi:hypothetical protein [Falsiroseomonas selenitidurans]|uniref:Clp R domain-containing protein n=1 Tax=Falsiroseomonas selenitidurans TaxID=2716335 RepID=A0ABX1E6A1_9PROT|nr:hypothetical protein [Falsiroseomonas selenitidurans]NKC32701.1 hypothetical protein [Falsiroseomonas selenitidurans]